MSKGNAAESAVLQAMIERDLIVLLPFGGGHPYDLVVDLAPTGFLRVQCKSARRYRGCATFNSRTTDHGNGRLPYDGRADLFGVYLHETRRVFLVPVREVTSYCVGLKLEPPMNNQKRRVRLAVDYEIDRWRVDDLRELVRDNPIRDRPGIDSA